MKRRVFQISFFSLLLSILLLLRAPSVKAQVALPAPDFSEIEKWYEVVKWDYEDTGKIVLVVKAKTPAPQTHRGFMFRYFDKDGVDTMSQGLTQVIGLAYITPQGESERVEVVAPAEAQMKKVSAIIVYRVLDDNSLTGPPFTARPKRVEPTPDKATKQEATEKAREQPKTNPPATQKPATKETPDDCFSHPQPPVDEKAKFSLDLVKSLLYARYSFETESKGISNPKAIGVDYVDIRLGKSYVNKVRVDPVRGALRIFDGAPPNAMIHTFKGNYIVCRKYSSGVGRTRYENDYVVFKGRDGKWNCAIDGIPKITELK